MEELSKILEKFNIYIKNHSIYHTAFTHRSFLNEVKDEIQSNERMEFLGDSVLSFIVSSHLFAIRPNDTEGQLTSLRAFIVKTQSLAKISQKLSLGKFLRLSKGEEISGGRENMQLLANTYEALLGAIFLDLGIDAATTFVRSTLLPVFGEELKSGAPKDAKSSLQELVQNKFQVSPRYKILSTSGPDHAKQFVVGVFLKGEQIGEGEGTNKQQAEEKAADQALLKLNL